MHVRNVVNASRHAKSLSYLSRRCLSKENDLNIENIIWRDVQPAYKVENDVISCVFTRFGLNLASLQFKDDPNPVNPFWQPPWPAIEDPGAIKLDKMPDDFKEIYGDTEESPLLSNIVGHNMCLDRFGASRESDSPRRQVHGEVGSAHFGVQSYNNNWIRFNTGLINAKIDINRTVTLDENKIRVNTLVEDISFSSLGNGRTDIEWAEHPSFGGEFLNGATMNASIEKSFNFPLPLPNSRFRDQPLCGQLDTDACLVMPAADSDEPVEEVTGHTIEKDNGIFEIVNKKLGYKLTYEFDTDVWPFFILWTEHYARQHKPWNGRTRVRGMEFASKPFPVADLERHMPEEMLETRTVDKHPVRYFEDRPIDILVKHGGVSSEFVIIWERI